MIRLLLTFLCLASLSAMEEGLKIRIPQAEQTVRVSIEEEANIRAEDRLQPLAKIKENTLAAALPDTGKDYVWIPGWDLTGTGALRVADAAAVLDGSVAAFLETVGKCEEAQGGRIILLDVLRKRIAGYFTVGRKLSALRLGNTLEYAVAFAEAQPVLKQPAGFVVLDLKEGKERSFHRTDKPVSFAVAGASLFFADAKGAVRMLNLEDGKSKTLFRAPCPLLRVSPDGTAVIAAAEDAFYRIDAASGEVASKEPRKERFRIGELVCTKPDGSGFLFSALPDTNGKCRLFLHVEGKQREIAADSAGRFVWQENGPNLFVMRVIKGRVFRLDPESLKDYSSCEPKSLRPATLGTVRWLFSGGEPCELVAMDSLGSVYTLKSVGKRWRKTLIVNAGRR